jgi:hypothetical protein
MLPSHTKLVEADLEMICESIASGLEARKGSRRSYAHS